MTMGDCQTIRETVGDMHDLKQYNMLEVATIIFQVATAQLQLRKADLDAEAAAQKIERLLTELQVPL